MSRLSKCGKPHPSRLPKCGKPHPSREDAFLCLVCYPCDHTKPYLDTKCLACGGCTNDACNNELRACKSCATGKKCTTHSNICDRKGDCLHADAHERDCALGSCVYHCAPCYLPPGTCQWHKE